MKKKPVAKKDVSELIDAPAFTEGDDAAADLKNSGFPPGDEVDFACRYEGCKGRRAIMTKATHGLVYYVCTTCRRTRTVNVGSSVSL